MKFKMKFPKESCWMFSVHYEWRHLPCVGKRSFRSSAVLYPAPGSPGETAALDGSCKVNAAVLLLHWYQDYRFTSIVKFSFSQNSVIQCLLSVWGLRVRVDIGIQSWQMLLLLCHDIINDNDCWCCLFSLCLTSQSVSQSHCCQTCSSQIPTSWKLLWKQPTLYLMCGIRQQHLQQAMLQHYRCPWQQRYLLYFIYLWLWDPA